MHLATQSEELDGVLEKIRIRAAKQMFEPAKPGHLAQIVRAEPSDVVHLLADDYRAG